MFFSNVPDIYIIVVTGGRQTETGADIANWLKCSRLCLEVILEGLEPIARLTTPTGREAQLLADTALNILYCQLADLYNCLDDHDGCIVLEVPLSSPSQLQNLILFMARHHRVRGLIIRENPQEFMFPQRASNTTKVPEKKNFYEEESFGSHIQKAIEKQNQRMISELNKLTNYWLYDVVVSELEIVPGMDDICLFEKSRRGEGPVYSPVLQAIEYLLFKRAEAQGPLSISMRQWGQIKYDLLGKQQIREKSAFCFQGMGDHDIIYKPRLSEPSSSKESAIGKVRVDHDSVYKPRLSEPSSSKESAIGNPPNSSKESAIGKVRVDHDSIYKPQPSEPRSANPQWDWDYFFMVDDYAEPSSGSDRSSSSSECGSCGNVTVAPDYAEPSSSSCSDRSSSSSECGLSGNVMVGANSAEPSSSSKESAISNPPNSSKESAIGKVRVDHDSISKPRLSEPSSSSKGSAIGKVRVDHDSFYKPRLSEPSSSSKESAIGKVRVDHDSIYKPQPSEPRSANPQWDWDYFFMVDDYAEPSISSCSDRSSSSSECELCGNVIVAADSAYSCRYCPLDLHKACAELQGVSRFLFPPFDLTPFERENHCCKYCKERLSSFTNSCKSCYYTSILKSHLRPMIVLHPFNRDQYVWINIVLSRFSHNYCAACGNTISSIVRYFDQYRTLYYGFFCIARLPLEVEHEHFRYRHTLKLMCEPQQEFDSHICHLCCRDRHPQTWFYYCEECDLEAHVYCVFIIHKNYH